MTTNETIQVTVSSVDGFRKSRSFKTLAGAQRFAARYVGETPDLSSYYAVSSYGTTKVESSTHPVIALFPKLAPEYGPDTGPEEPEVETEGHGYDGADELTGQEEHDAYMAGAYGDARRCPRHPHVKTSSDDGNFDCECHLCESEEMDAYDAARRAEPAYYISPGVVEALRAEDALKTAPKATDDNDNDLPF